jgi:cytochrome c-type biogenesis protein CcmE
MHPVRRQRLIIVLFIVFGASIAAALVFSALTQNMNLFHPPSDIVSGKAPVDKRMRIGGMVVNGSVKRDTQSLKVRFDITDYAATVPVEYEGILPDLFAEGEGVVGSGVLQANGVFKADEILAKHDENYMPPEVADTLKKKPAFVHEPSTHEQSSGTLSPGEKH